MRLTVSIHLQVIDDYVRESPVLTSVARDWFSTATLACDRVLGLLTSAHSLAKSNYKLKAKVRNKCAFFFAELDAQCYLFIFAKYEGFGWGTSASPHPPTQYQCLLGARYYGPKGFAVYTILSTPVVEKWISCACLPSYSVPIFLASASV